jgi:membrane-bound lytic murein transglycosylase D
MRGGSFLRGLAGLALVLSARTAAADPPAGATGPVEAGTQAAPPTAAPRPSLEQELDGRRAVRGCPVEDCAATGAAKAAMLPFELGAFPAPGADPWIDDASPPRTSERARTVTRPSQLRPDLPWLDELELPDLPVVWSEKLIDYLVFYRDDPHGHNIMKGWLAEQGRYREMILARLRQAKLPEDLLYVAMIESGYDPGETSYAGASGLWQFMPDGGRIYGLRIDRWVDERNDPLRATIAVLDYFADLHQRFGDWPLALAAYNAGYGAVLRAIARNNTNDYYRLSELENGLPWGTTNYVPKALAAAICGRNRTAMGFDAVKPDPAERWEEAAVPGSVSLATVARAVGVGVDEVKRLNPHLRRGRTPPGEPGYVVRVPRGTGETFARKLADLRSDWDGMDAYVMAYGERFEDVATTFGISTSKLRQLNDIAHESEVGGGSVLVVPKIDAAKREANRAKAIAALHASGPDQRPGEPLLVAVPDKDARVDGKRRVFYRVVIGDRLDAIAGALGVKPAQLVAWNALSDTAELHPRMVLQAWVAAGFDAARANVRLLDDDKLMVVTRGSKEHMDIAEARIGRERIEYAPKKAESLEVIGKKFGLGPRDLARINRIESNSVIHPGQSIIVYRVVDKSRSDRAAEQWKKAPKDQRGGKKAPVKPKATSKVDAPAPSSSDDVGVAADAGATPPAAPGASPAPAAKRGRQPRVAGPVTSPADLDAAGDDDDSAAPGRSRDDSDSEDGSPRARP